MMKNALFAKRDLHKFADWTERAGGGEPIEGEKASELLKEGLGGDWWSSRACMGKWGLDKNLWGKKTWGNTHENQTLREFTPCDLGFLPAERKERWLRVHIQRLWEVLIPAEENNREVIAEENQKINRLSWRSLGGETSKLCNGVMIFCNYVRFSIENTYFLK